MKIIITTENTELWRNLANSFDDKSIKFVESYSDLESNTDCELLFCQQPVIDFECLANDLKTGKVESAIVFYQQSEFVLAGAITQGESLDSAANHWNKKSDDLLKVKKQNRRKLKLVNLNQALLHPTAFITQMEECGISFFKPFDYQVNSNFSLLIANQHVRQEKTLTHLNNLLTASSLPVCENSAIIIDNSSVLEQSIAEIKSIQNLEEECELFNSKIKEKDQINFVGNKELERERAIVTSLQEELELQNNSMVKQVEDVKLENELLELQLASVQEELEQIYSNFESEKQKHQETKVALTTQINDSSVQFEKVKSEVEILELQLSQVQEELEEYYLANQSKDKLIDELKIEWKSLKQKNANTEKQLANSSNLVTSLNNKIANLNTSASYKDKTHAKDLQQIKLKQMELDKQSSQITKAKNEIDILNHNLNQAKAELAQIKSSTLWRSTGPMRRLVKAVNNVDKKKAKLQQNIGLLLTSEYFDAKWYIETYPDVAASEINPAEHYLKFGAQEGRFPSPQFDGNWYLERYPDIADADINPLIHFIKFGISEGRSASPTMLVNQNKP